MARVTVEDCLDHVDNRFELVMLASKRARQLSIGGKEAKVALKNDKPTVLALREIAGGYITTTILAQEERTAQEALFNHFDDETSESV